MLKRNSMRLLMSTNLQNRRVRRSECCWGYVRDPSQSTYAKKQRSRFLIDSWHVADCQKRFSSAAGRIWRSSVMYGSRKDGGRAV